MNLKTLYLLLSVAFTTFTLCSLQFHELRRISHKATMAAHKDGTLAPDNLPRVLKSLELLEQRNRLNKSDQPLSESAEWSDAKEKLIKFSNRLKLKNTLHRDISQKISRILLRDTVIGGVLMLSSLAAILFSIKAKKVT